MTATKLFSETLRIARKPVFVAAFSTVCAWELIDWGFLLSDHSEHWQIRPLLALGYLMYPLFAFWLARRLKGCQAMPPVFCGVSVALFVVGAVLLAKLGEWSGLVNKLLILAAGGATLLGYVSVVVRREEQFALAEARGWKISEKEQGDFEWDALLLRGMTPRQRVLFNIVMVTGVATILVVFMVLTAFEKRWLLGIWFMAVVAGLSSYFSRILSREFAKKNQLGVELDVAKQMQMSLMPTEAPKLSGFDIAGTTFPAEEVGGDLFSYMPMTAAGGSLGIAVADVSGKGMKAAIATVLVSGMLRAEKCRSENPAQFLGAINSALVGGIDPKMFVAMQILVLDPVSGRIAYSNAGQVHPVLLKRGRVSEIALNALPLGIVECAEYGTLALELEAGDILFLISDGITEAMDERREIFGSERVENLLLSLDTSKRAKELLDFVAERVDAFRGKAPPSDDRTMVVVKRV